MNYHTLFIHSDKRIAPNTRQHNSFKCLMKMVGTVMMASVMILNRFEFWPVLSSRGEAWRDQLTMVADFAGDDGDGENVTGMITMRSLMI